MHLAPGWIIAPVLLLTIYHGCGWPVLRKGFACARLYIQPCTPHWNYSTQSAVRQEVRLVTSRSWLPPLGLHFNRGPPSGVDGRDAPRSAERIPCTGDLRLGPVCAPSDRLPPERRWSLTRDPCEQVLSSGGQPFSRPGGMQGNSISALRSHCSIPVLMTALAL